ncbi:hypothetical protein F2Q69_00054557 [Brassica cretica]|uniref:Uncharacterized protein n=1 Tax=Brassica cretica TaxID=69181 RepID=A0A8S9MZK3_BRACR|nr:hypothetical protein F2Q69_00054557 [Brassica cretica]
MEYLHFRDDGLRAGREKLKPTLEEYIRSPRREAQGENFFRANSALRNFEALFSTCSVSMTGTRLPDKHVQAVRPLGSLLNYIRLDPRNGYVRSLS